MGCATGEAESGNNITSQTRAADLGKRQRSEAIGHASA